MKYAARLAIALVPWFGCAQATEETIDAPSGVIDAAPDTAVIDTATDAPEIDAATDAATDAAIDAATDAATDAAVPIDAPIDAATPIDAPIDAPPGGPVDTCAQALDITAAAMAPAGTTITGNLTGYANNIQPASSCTGFTNDGPDAIYSLNLAAGRVITATVNAPTWDSAVEIVQPCQMTPTCLVGDDAGDPESVTYTTVAAGVFYVIVDSWDVGSFGPYTLTVRVQ